MDIPIRTNMTVLPADDPKKLRLGWCIYENHGPHMLPTDDDACYEFDIADTFKGSHGETPQETRKHIWAVVPQLEFLKGQPWNNLALNYVMGLRPSSIRVTTGCVTADAYTWRVTVYLEKDGRTIKRIEQECNTGTIGVDCGYDLKLKLHQQLKGEKMEPFDASHSFINPDAIKKLKIDVPKEEAKKGKLKSPMTVSESVGKVIINKYAFNKINRKNL